MSNEEVKVRNNEAESRFESTIDGSLAVAEYQLSPGRITFTHTEVPEALSGRGIAGKLVREALDYARREKLEVVAECAYVAEFIRRHPQYQDLVSDPASL